MRATTGVIVIALGAAACGGGDTDYFAQPPDEAADTLAVRGCAGVFDCGVITIDCDPDVATYEPATTVFASEDACVTELTAEYNDTFAGCIALGLSETQKADINACFNESQDCLSESALMELAIQACNDQPLGSERCNLAHAWLDDCRSCFMTPTDPMCDGV